MTHCVIVTCDLRVSPNNSNQKKKETDVFQCSAIKGIWNYCINGNQQNQPIFEFDICKVCISLGQGVAPSEGVALLE